VQKVKNIWEKIKTWSLTKKIIYGIIVIILVFFGYIISKPKDNSDNITTDTVKLVDLKQTVLATGQVTSNTDLVLSFYNSGIVRSLKVKVGNEVKEGQILATLDQASESAALTTARAGLAAAKAKYQKILDGSSNEEIALAKVALENAKNDFERVRSQQEILVSNARRNFYSNDLEAKPYSGTIGTAPTISGSYNGTIMGEYRISVDGSQRRNFRVNGIEKMSDGDIDDDEPQKLGTMGLMITFPDGAGSYSENDGWYITIPNIEGVNYVSNYNAYQSALKTQESALGTAQALIDQRTAELVLKQASATKAELDLAKADILSAQGQLQLANANFEHTILRAPADGMITKVDIKIGELAQALKDVMTLQDVNNVYLEANINEANITSIKVRAPVDVTFDAFNTEEIFKGSILKIDPSSTIISGVVNYKITANVFNVPELRPGMTANMTILVGEKNNVLTIPSRAIIKDKTGKKTVRLVTNPKTKIYKEVEVATGMEGDSGLVEITSGLNENDEIVILIKK